MLLVTRVNINDPKTKPFFTLQPNLPTPVQRLLFRQQPFYNVYVKRDDLIDPVISGNKWRKLKYHLKQFQQSNKTAIHSFGGAYSNHLHALAKLCHQMNIPSFGWVRGQELTTESNATLKDISQWGMQLEFVSREQYRTRNDRATLEALQAQRPDSYIIPEGGFSVAAIDGCRELLRETPDIATFQHIMVAIGTGATLAGLLIEAHFVAPKTQIHGICALKNGGYLQDAIEALVEQYIKTQSLDVSASDIMQRCDFHTDYHFGGFGKQNQQYDELDRQFIQHLNIEFDSVYNGKAVLATKDLIEKQRILPGEKVLLVHTGGLQGKRSR